MRFKNSSARCGRLGLREKIFFFKMRARRTWPKPCAPTHTFTAMKTIQSASVCGLGKLGACIAATLAQQGFDVIGVDIDAEKVRKINEGLAPVDEPLLAETIAAGKSRLRATVDHREVVGTDVTFFIPPSPSLPDGSFATEFLLKAMQPVAKALREAGKTGHIFVCSSTTTPGAAWRRLYSLRSMSRTMRSTVALSKPASTMVARDFPSTT